MSVYDQEWLQDTQGMSLADYRRKRQLEDMVGARQNPNTLLDPNIFNVPNVAKVDLTAPGVNLRDISQDQFNQIWDNNQPYIYIRTRFQNNVPYAIPNPNYKPDAPSVRKDFLTKLLNPQLDDVAKRVVDETYASGNAITRKLGNNGNYFMSAGQLNQDGTVKQSTPESSALESAWKAQEQNRGELTKQFAKYLELAAERGGPMPQVPVELVRPTYYKDMATDSIQKYEYKGNPNLELSNIKGFGNFAKKWGLDQPSNIGDTVYHDDGSYTRNGVNYYPVGKTAKPQGATMRAGTTEGVAALNNIAPIDNPTPAPQQQAFVKPKRQFETRGEILRGQQYENEIRARQKASDGKNPFDAGKPVNQSQPDSSLANQFQKLTVTYKGDRV